MGELYTRRLGRKRGASVPQSRRMLIAMISPAELLALLTHSSEELDALVGEHRDYFAARNETVE